MANRIWAIVAILVTTTTTLRADMSFRVFPDSHPDIHIRIENMADYPEYDFYLRYVQKTSHHITRIPPKGYAEFEGTGNRLRSLVVIAVPHGQPKPALTEQFEYWFNYRPKRGMRSSEFLVSRHERSFLTYRMAIVDGRLQLTLVDVVSKKNSPMIAIIGLSLSAILIALVFYRRRRRKALVTAT